MTLEQCFLNFSMHENHLESCEGMNSWTLLAVGLDGAEFCVFKKLPGEADVIGPQVTLSSTLLH